MTEEKMQQVFDLYYKRRDLQDQVDYLQKVHKKAKEDIDKGNAYRLPDVMDKLWKIFEATLPDYFLKTLDKTISQVKTDLDDVNKQIEAL